MIRLRRLSTGWYRLQGHGPCNWAQVPRWPCTANELESGFFEQAGDEFRYYAHKFLRRELEGR